MTANVAEQPVGEVTHFFGKIRVATVRVHAPIKLGDRLHVKGANDDFTVRVKSMEIDHKPIEEAKPGDVVGIRMPSKAHAGDRVLRAAADSGGWGWLRKLLGS